MKKTTKIDDLQSMQARHLVRGMISNTAPSEMMKLLKKIRENCSDSDFKIAIQILRENIVFRNNPISVDFSKVFVPPLEPPVNYSVDNVVKEISKNSVRLIKIVKRIILIIGYVNDYDPEKALQECEKLIQEAGASIFLLRILYFIRNQFVDDMVTVRSVDHLLFTLNVVNINYLSIAIRELTSPRTDYFNISDKVQASEDSTSVLVARSFIDHVPRSIEIFTATLSAYYGFSLLDACLYYFSTSRFALPFVRGLDNLLYAQLLELAKADIDVGSYYDSTDDNVGLQIFRDSFLLIELNRYFEYRTIHGCIYNSLEEKELRRLPIEKKYITAHFCSVASVGNIGTQTSSYSLRPAVYDRTQACCFENSNALMYFLEKNDGEINSEEIEFVRLMSLTRDIGIICPIRYIEAIKIKACSDELRLVATCLSYIKEKSQLKEHELRGVIQEIAIRRYDSQLTELLDAMHVISPSVTSHLISTIDETFLSKLFQIVKNPNRAIEVRAEILEWYGHKISDFAFIERAKNLRIDVQISREKGTIDDSRIYVDPVKFTQWINNKVITSITILLEGLPAGVESNVVPLNWEKVKTSLAANDQIGSILLTCYEEFCSNKIYGVASYLGRRIRHGTLKGTGLNNVTSFATDAKYQRLFAVKEFADAFNSWLDQYEQFLDKLRDRFLHIQDKSKPEGMLLRNFRSATSRVVANHMFHEVLKSFETHKNGVELPYIITDFCWRLIEEDLQSVRKFVMEKKAKYAIFRFDAPSDFELKHREIQEFCQELNSVTVDKFRTISSWFNKPSIASPSADIVLLFKAVVSEIRGFFPDYSPEVSVDENDFIISGGQYFVIYDALFILIYNAAKYGLDCGILNMNLGFKESANRKNINISITSELNENDSAQAVEDSITSALEGDCEDALVIEGRSGIKKLRRMEQDNYIDCVHYQFFARKVVASFNFGLDYST